MRAWIQDPVPPRTHYKERPGRWVAETRWPISGAEPLVLRLGEHVLAEQATAPERHLTISSPETVGLAAGKWCPYGVEADEPGAGASGRNTGFVIPNVQTPNGPNFVVDTFGTSAGAWLVDKIGGSAEFLFRLVDRVGIDCEAEQIGWVQAAHSSELAAVLHRVSREWEGFGVAAQLLDAGQMEDVLGFRRYPAGIRFATGGQINPLAYVRGLAAAGRSRGALRWGC